MKKEPNLNPYSSKARGKKQINRAYSKFYHNSPGLTTLHKLVLEQNLSDIPGGDNWHLTAFLISNAEYDLARMSDEQLETLVAGLPCGGYDA